MKCSRCPAETGYKATVMCPECHAKEVARVHAHDTPDAPDVPVEGYQPPPSRSVRPGSDGRRVIRKPNPMS